MRSLRRWYFQLVRNYHEIKITDERLSIRQAEEAIRRHRAKIALAEYNTRIL